MQNKLQELTDKLYNEGLSKGQQEANSLLSKAEEKARRIVEDARKKADQLVSEAERKADEAKKNADVEIALTGRQVLTRLKQAAGDALTAKAVSEPIKLAMSEVEFVKQLVLAAVQRFDTDSLNSTRLAVLLPADKQEQLKDFAESKALAQLNAGVEVQFSKLVKTGFRIGAKDKGYYISFTDGDFENLFKEYLRPSIQELLFGKQP